jgi:polyferredoxin
MELSKQFQVILASFLFGILFMIVYDFINRATYYKKGKIIRFIIELITFIFLSFLYFLIMLKISNNQLNIFLPLFIILGIITYILLLQSFFQHINEIIFNKIKCKRLSLKAKFDIIKMERRKKKKKRKYEKNKKSKESNNYN